MLIKYLKSKGLYNMTEAECDAKFKDIMYQHYMKDYEDATISEIVPASIEAATHTITESHARDMVSQMYHIRDGKKYIGERYDMTKAEELCARYQGILPQSVTPIIMYLAINSHYHDYCELLKVWFGDNIDSKVFEAAIKYWFKDDDFKGSCKVTKHFLR